jgi:hypothetical protein
VQYLVNRSRAIVIGTVRAVSEPVVERPYDFNVVDEVSLVKSIRNAVPRHDFLPAGEWPGRFETGGPPAGKSGPAGNAGEGES